MKILHYEKNFVFRAPELLTIARKLGKLATYCKRIQDEASVIRVETLRRATKKERDQVKVMITVELPRATLRAESRRTDVVEAMDRCIEKLEPQVKRYKELGTHRGRTQAKQRRLRKSRRALAHFR